MLFPFEMYHGGYVLGSFFLCLIIICECPRIQKLVGYFRLGKVFVGSIIVESAFLPVIVIESEVTRNVYDA